MSAKRTLNNPEMTFWQTVQQPQSRCTRQQPNTNITARIYGITAQSQAIEHRIGGKSHEREGGEKNGAPCGDGLEVGHTFWYILW